VCIICSEVYLDRYVDKLECRFNILSTKRTTWPMHKCDQEFDFECFLYYLKHDKGLSWKVIHALLLSHLLMMPQCRTCNKQSTLADLKNCRTHPIEAFDLMYKLSEKASNQRPGSLRFNTALPCCGQYAMWHMPFFKLSEFSMPEGCILRDHDFNMDYVS
jgi:hypothetical protein